MEKISFSVEDLRSLFWSLWLMFAFAVFVGLFLYDLVSVLVRRVLIQIRQKFGFSPKENN